MVKAIKLFDWFGQGSRYAAPVLTPSLASQLLQGSAAYTKLVNNANHCRSWLVGSPHRSEGVSPITAKSGSVRLVKDQTAVMPRI
jgi:hypothetical protein